jgi:hypothetical protein
MQDYKLYRLDRWVHVSMWTYVRSNVNKTTMLKGPSRGVACGGVWGGVTPPQF